MTPFEQVLINVFQVDLWGVAKLAVLLFLGIYIVFAFIVVRQVRLMTSVLNGSIDLPLRAIALAHLAIAVMVFLMALTVL